VEVLAAAEGLKASLGRLKAVARVRAGAAEIPDSLIFDRRHIDGGQLA
jgi:hypothetical protein